MLNIRKSTFLIGLLVVTNLLLLGGCGSCGKKEDPKQKLEKEQKRLIGEIAKKLKATGEQEKILNEQIQETKKEQKVEELKNQLEKLKGAQTKLLQANHDLVGQVVVNRILREFAPGFGLVFGGNIEEARKLAELSISLQENFIEQIELRDKAKK